MICSEHTVSSALDNQTFLINYCACLDKIEFDKKFMLGHRNHSHVGDSADLEMSASGPPAKKHH